MSYPDHFQFCHENTTQLYNMHRQKGHAHPLWACSKASDERYGEGALYNEAQIQYNFDNGHWQEISQAESVEPEISVGEPQMKFPFTFTAPSDSSGRTYTALGKEVGAYHKDAVRVVWESDYGGVTYPYKRVKELIKNGDWVVTSVGSPSVGEQPKEEAAKVDSLSLTIEVNSAQAVADMQNATLVAIADMQNLAQAVENVTIALQSLQEQLAEMGLFGHVDDSCAAFCCEG